MSIFERIPFVIENGNSANREVTIYALSTCGFCKRAITYLKDRNVSFRYVYVDTLHHEVRQELRNALKDTFQRSLLYPYLVVDGKEVVTGFSKEKWDRLIGLAPTEAESN